MRWGVVGGRARAAPTAATAALAVSVVLLAVVGRAAASLIRVAIAA